MVSIDIVLPCFNPQADWDKRLISSYLLLSEKVGTNTIHIILVNDGSDEKYISETQIHQLKTQIPNFQYYTYSKNMGKGYAVRYGVQKSTAEICIYTDIDFPYTPESQISIIQSLMHGADIAAGIKNKSYYKQVPILRRIISKTLRYFTAFFLRLKINDTQCGLKGFNQKGKEIFLKTSMNRYLFDLEFIYVASSKKNLKIEEVPVQLNEGVIFSRMPLKILFTELMSFISILMRSIFKK